MALKYTSIEDKPAYEIMHRNGYITYAVSCIYSKGKLQVKDYVQIKYSDYLFN